MEEIKNTAKQTRSSAHSPLSGREVHQWGGEGLACWIWPKTSSVWVLRPWTLQVVSDGRFSHPCSPWSFPRSPWRCARAVRSASPPCFLRQQPAAACEPTAASAEPRTASGTRLRENGVGLTGRAKDEQLWHFSWTLTWFDVAVVSGDSSVSRVNREAAGVSVAFSLLQLLLFPHLLPVPQKKNSVLQDKVPTN